MIVPLLSYLSDVFERLMILIKEVLWQLAHILTILEFSGSYLGGVLKITIFIKDFMDLILDFSLQVQIFK